MKTNRLISAMILATIFLSFTACSNDDDSINGGNGQSGKRVAKIVNEYDDFIRTEIFSYSNGKLSHYTAKYDNKTGYENNQTITYSGNTVVLKGLFDGSDCVQTYTLNNSGLATSCKIVNKNSGSEKDYIFQYSDGYLIGMSFAYSSKDYNSSEIYIFNYSNGNMTKLTHKDNYETRTYSFTYYNDLNKGNIMNEFMSDDLFAHRAAFYAGILGKATKNLPKSNGQYDVVYYLDNDGYVKTATDVEYKYTYTYE